MTFNSLKITKTRFFTKITSNNEGPHCQCSLQCHWKHTRQWTLTLFSLSHLPHAGVDWLICNCTNSTAAGWRGLSSRPAACRPHCSLCWDTNSILFKQINTISRTVCNLTHHAGVWSRITSGMWRDADVVKPKLGVSWLTSCQLPGTQRTGSECVFIWYITPSRKV